MTELDFSCIFVHICVCVCVCVCVCACVCGCARMCTLWYWVNDKEMGERTDEKRRNKNIKFSA